MYLDLSRLPLLNVLSVFFFPVSYQLFSKHFKSSYFPLFSFLIKWVGWYKLCAFLRIYRYATNCFDELKRDLTVLYLLDQCAACFS